MLEALEHEQNSFVTLTYRDDAIPVGGSLRPKDLQDWIKRFRFRWNPGRIRFYAVGEYGDRSERPHYHLALFGAGCSFGRVDGRGSCQCLTCSAVRETWTAGHSLVAQLERKSAQYIAGYVTKKMTSRDDLRLAGREPEFSRMSLRPGIGANVMFDVASEVMRYAESASDVPSVLRSDGKLMPLGRYLRRRLRVLCGREEGAPDETIREAQKDVQVLFDYARSHIRQGELRRLFVKNAIVDANEGIAVRAKHKERVKI